MRMAQNGKRWSAEEKSYTEKLVENVLKITNWRTIRCHDKPKDGQMGLDGVTICICKAAGKAKARRSD